MMNGICLLLAILIFTTIAAFYPRAHRVYRWLVAALWLLLGLAWLLLK